MRRELGTEWRAAHCGFPRGGDAAKALIHHVCVRVGVCVLFPIFVNFFVQNRHNIVTVAVKFLTISPTTLSCEKLGAS